MNLYGYVEQDPVNYVDVTGEEPVSTTLGIGLGGGEAAIAACTLNPALCAATLGTVACIASPWCRDTVQDVGQDISSLVDSLHNMLSEDSEGETSGECTVGKRLTPDQEAMHDLIDKIKKRKKALDVEDAETLLDWMEEIKYPGRRADGPDVRGEHWKEPHIHGGRKHIPVKP